MASLPGLEEDLAADLVGGDGRVHYLELHVGVRREVVEQRAHHGEGRLARLLARGLVADVGELDRLAEHPGHHLGDAVPVHGVVADVGGHLARAVALPAAPLPLGLRALRGVLAPARAAEEQPEGARALRPILLVGSCSAHRARLLSSWPCASRAVPGGPGAARPRAGSRSEAGLVREQLRGELVCRQERQQLLGAHAEGPPEPGEPERHAAEHDREGRVRDVGAQAQVDEGRRPDGAAEAERHACERAQAHLPDDLLLVLADVLLHRYPERHPRRPLCRQPGRVQLPEVDRRGDDDRAAGDGGYGGRDLRAALLLPDGQAERDRAPDDQEAAEEGHAARHELDDVCEHAALLCFRLTMFLAVTPPRRGRPASSAAPSRGAVLPPAVLREVERAAAHGLLEQARSRVALEPVLPVHERHAPVHEHERVLARHARHLGGLYEVALGDAAVHGPGPAGAPRVAPASRSPPSACRPSC